MTNLPELKEFDMNKLVEKPNQNIVIIGKKNTGKSTLIKNILFYLKDKLPIVIAMSGSESLNNFYKKLIPDMFVYSDINISKFTHISDRQNKFIEHVNHGTESFTGLNDNIGLILDDCIADTTWTKDESMNHFVTNGRHMKLTLIVAVQAIKSLPPIIRGNIDYIFILRCNSTNERRKYRDDFLGLFNSKKQFDYTFEKYTDNYKAFVIDNVNQSNDMRDVYFWYKADINIKLKLCKEVYWDINKMLLDKYYKTIYNREETKINN